MTLVSITDSFASLQTHALHETVEFNKGSQISSDVIADVIGKDFGLILNISVSNSKSLNCCGLVLIIDNEEDVSM